MARRAAVRVVAAHAADFRALVALDAECFPVCDRFPQRTWRHLLSRRRSAVVLVVRCDRQPVGAIVGLLRAGSRVVRIYSIAIAPAMRGRGLGSRLIGALLAAVPARVEIVSLEVRSDNPARGLYQALGLHAVDTMAGYYDDGADGVRYRGDRAEVSRRCRGK